MELLIDGQSKIISLTSGTTSLSVRELWSRWVDWFLTGSNSRFLPAFSQTGGDDIDILQGIKIPIYIFLKNGWRIRPQESNHTLNVNDGILIVDGGGDPFVNTIGSFTVRVNYQQPVQAISFSSSGGVGGGLTTEQANQLLEIYKLQGLDSNSPLTITKTNKIVDNIEIIVTGDGINTATITRQS